MIQKTQRAQRGYTIVELSVSVAIAGVLLVGSIALVQTVLNTARANDTITSISRIIAQVDKIWANTNSYAGLTLAAAGGAGVFEGLTIVRTGTPPVVTGVTHKFNRNVTVGVNSEMPSAGANRGYTMTFTGIPTSVCADIVSAAASSGIRGILIQPETVAGTTTTPLSGATIKLKADESFDTLPASTVAAVDGATSGVQIANMTGANGCGTDKATVSIGFVNWK